MDAQVLSLLVCCSTKVQILTLTGGLHWWGCCVDAQRGLRARFVAARRMLALWRAPVLLEVLERWRHHVIEEKLIKRNAVKVVQRVVNGALVSTFERWRHHILEEKRMRMKALQVVQRLMSGALVSAFERWRDRIIEEKQMKSKAMRVVQRLMSGALVSAFERWSAHIIEAQQMKCKALRVVERLTKAPVPASTIGSSALQPKP